MRSFSQFLAEDAPLVYHGTHSDFAAFNTRRSTATNKMGAYFTTNKTGAMSFGPRLITARLHLSKPFDTRGMQAVDLARRFAPDNRPFLLDTERLDSPMYTVLEYLDRKNDLVSRLKRQGYDGIIFDDSIDGITYVVFNPDDIEIVSDNGGD